MNSWWVRIGSGFNTKKYIINCREPTLFDFLSLSIPLLYVNHTSWMLNWATRFQVLNDMGLFLYSSFFFAIDLLARRSLFPFRQPQTKVDENINNSRVSIWFFFCYSLWLWIFFTFLLTERKFFRLNFNNLM